MMQLLRRWIQHKKEFLRLPQMLMLCMALVMLSNDALARPMMHDGGGYNVNTRPPSFSNYKDEETVPPGVGEGGGYLFFSNESFFTYTARGTRKNIALQAICNEGYFTERVVTCIRTIVNSSMTKFLDEFALILNGYILGLITLAITLFGAKVITGTVQNPGSAAISLLIKVAAVLLFTKALGGFVPSIFPIMESMAGYAMSYISHGDTSTFLTSCGEAGGMTDVSIWGRVDCIIQRLFTGNTAADGNGYAVGVLWVLMVAVFWTTFLGFFVAFVMLATFFMLFLLVIRCVYVFLASYVFLAMLVVISPLIIPLILFENAGKMYFNKWIRHFLSMMVQPMLLFAYMSFVFALVDGMFFKDEPYSLARVLGVNWETPDVSTGFPTAAIEEKLALYAEETQNKEGDAQYEAYRRYLESHIEYMAIGNVLLEKQQLISIEVNAASDFTSGLHDVPVVGRAIEAGANVVDGVVNWGLDHLSKALIPFEVVRIKPEGRTQWGFMMDLLKFFLVTLIFLPLMLKFSSEIPQYIQRLSSAIQTPGSKLPGERQVLGTIGAVKGGAKGVVQGAAVGFVTGGKKGAVVGAVEGGTRGAVSGYRQASGTRSAGAQGGGLAGSAHGDSIHAQKGDGTDRKLLHGEKGGGRFGGAGSLLTDAAFTFATRGKGGKGGGGAKGV